MDKLRYIGACIFLVIVVYVNLYENNDIWDFIGYLQYYLLASFFCIVSWVIYPNIVWRSITLTIAAYYLFEFSMDILEIFNSKLHTIFYTKKNINYIVSLAMALSLQVLYIKKIIKKFKSSKK